MRTLLLLVAVASGCAQFTTYVPDDPSVDARGTGADGVAPGDVALDAGVATTDAAASDAVDASADTSDGYDSWTACQARCQYSCMRSGSAIACCRTSSTCTSTALCTSGVGWTCGGTGAVFGTTQCCRMY